MRLALLLVGGLALLLAGLLGVQLAQPWSGDPDQADATGVVPASRVRPPVASPTVAAAPVLHGDEWVTTILARPLFTRDRRPAAPVSAVAAASGGGGLPRLTGIAISPERRRAIFAGTDGAKPIVVEEGGSIGAFTVQAIGPDGVKVAGPDGQRTVALAFDPTPVARADADQPQPMTPPMQYGMPFPQPPPYPQPGLGFRPGPGLQPGLGMPGQGFGIGRPGPALDPTGQPIVRPNFVRPRADLGGTGSSRPRSS